MNHYTLAQMTPGLTEEFTVTVTPEMMDAFRAITGDVSPIHIDADYARGRGFPGRVVYGMLGASFFSTLAGVYLPGEHCLLHGVECKFAKPIFIGDTLTVKGTVVGVSEIGSEAEIKAVITNQDGKRVTKFACVDGPDFNGYEVDFDEAMSRGRMYFDFERHAYEETCNLFSKQ